MYDWDLGNIVTDLLKLVSEDDIEAVVIGSDWYTGKHYIPNYEQQPLNKVLSWSEAKKWLDYDFDAGFGGAECNSVYVWTKDKIFFISEYDGSTTLKNVPRNPIDIEPKMI